VTLRTTPLRDDRARPLDRISTATLVPPMSPLPPVWAKREGL